MKYLIPLIALAISCATLWCVLSLSAHTSESDTSGLWIGDTVGLVVENGREEAKKLKGYAGMIQMLEHIDCGDGKDVEITCADDAGNPTECRPGVRHRKRCPK